MVHSYVRTVSMMLNSGGLGPFPSVKPGQEISIVLF